MDNSIEARVKRIVAKQLGVSLTEVKNDSSFMNDLGADSLDVIELTMATEDEFGFDIDDEAAERFDTPQSIIDHVNTMVKREDASDVGLIKARAGEVAIPVHIADL